MKKIKIDVRCGMDLELHPDCPKKYVREIVRKQLLREHRKEVSRQLKLQL